MEKHFIAENVDTLLIFILVCTINFAKIKILVNFVILAKREIITKLSTFL